MKNIEELNPKWSSEFMCNGINYYEDRCNSIELQAIELLGACVHVCTRACVCVCVRVCGLVCLYVVCVLWGYTCNN